MMVAQTTHEMKDAAFEKVRRLREETGCRLLDCHKALKECNGDVAKALKMLRKKTPLWTWS